MVGVSGLEAYPEGQAELEGLQSGAGAERVVFHILNSTVEVFKRNPELVERAFRLLPKSERLKIRKILTDKPLRVTHGWPRRGAFENSKTQAIAAVTVGGGSMEQAFLDGFSHAEDIDLFNDEVLDPECAVVNAEIDREEIAIWMLSKHHDVLLYFFRLLRSILIGGNLVLLRSNIHPIGLSWVDVRPDEAYLPEFTYVRRMNLTVRYTSVSALDSGMITAILLEARNYDGEVIGGSSV